MACCNSPPGPSSSDDGSQICHDYISEKNILDKIKQINSDNNPLINNDNNLSTNSLHTYNQDTEHHDIEIDFDSNPNPRPWSVKRKRTSTNSEFRKIEEFTGNNEILHKKDSPPDHIKPAFLLAKKCFKEYRLVGYHVAEFQRRNDTGTPTLKLISPTIGAPGLAELDPIDMKKILDSLTEVSLIYSKTILDQLKKILIKKKDKYLKAINILKNLNTSLEYTALRNKLVAQVNYDIQKKCHPKPLYENSPTVKILVRGITHSININNLTNFKETITAEYEEPNEGTRDISVINEPLSPSQLLLETLPEDGVDIEQEELMPVDKKKQKNPDSDHKNLNIALKNITNELKHLAHTVTMLKKDTTYLMENRTRQSRSSSRGPPDQSGNIIRNNSPTKDPTNFVGQRNHESTRNYNVGQRNNGGQRDYEPKRDYNEGQSDYGRNTNSVTRNSDYEINYGSKIN